MNKKLLMLVALLCALPTLSALAKSEPQNVLTLKQALKNTEQQNLQLKRYPYHQKILTALKSQAALSPNPELSHDSWIVGFLRLGPYSLRHQSGHIDIVMNGEMLPDTECKLMCL